MVGGDKRLGEGTLTEGVVGGVDMEVVGQVS